MVVTSQCLVYSYQLAPVVITEKSDIAQPATETKLLGKLESVG